MNTTDIKKVIGLHALWIEGNPDGQHANLRGANLQHANLQHADLQHADLWGADLQRADLRGANLQHADLRGANLQHADLRDANLRDANLRDANLQHADLRGADLRDAIGNKSVIRSIQIETYSIAYTSEVLQIGCERHTFSEWSAFTDDEIIKMDGRIALKFWRKWKEWLFQTIEMCPAEPTGYQGDES